MTRNIPADQLTRVLAILHAEGWVLTPSTFSINDAGAIQVLLRSGDDDLGETLVNRLRELIPEVIVEPIYRMGLRHFVVRRPPPSPATPSD